MELRDIPAKHQSNVSKQIRQLSFCLNQAFEFAQSAKTSGPSTKPLQTYYCITSLANAVILWNGDGDVSFERRNSKYNRHGLELRTAKSVMEHAARIESANGAGAGLFGLWRDHAHHVPRYGKRTVVEVEIGSSVWSYEALTDMPPLNGLSLPDYPISLADCFKFIPGMQVPLAQSGIQGRIARANETLDIRIEKTRDKSTSRLHKIIHPAPDETLNSIYSRFEFPAGIVEHVSVKEFRKGLSITVTITHAPEYRYVSKGPSCISDTKDQMYLIGEGDYLNEFGYYYLGSYILGMICRYHPQIWMNEIGRSSLDSLLSDEFIDTALARAPLIVADIFLDTLTVYDG